MKKTLNETKTDCFAYKQKNGHVGCKALNKIDCQNCKFYRNNISDTDIERDVRHYANTYR